MKLNSLQNRIDDLIKQKYDIWNSYNISEMLKSIVLELGYYENDCYYVYIEDDLEIIYDLDMSGDFGEFLEVCYKDVCVFANEDIYTGHCVKNPEWLKKVHSLYFEANKQFLVCEL